MERKKLKISLNRSLVKKESNERKKWFIGVFLLFLALPLMLAAPKAPTSLVFEDNALPSFDEGAFKVNWASGGGDAEFNYTIYVFSDGIFYATGSNQSVTGISFSESVEANYSFIIEAWNGTGYRVNSSSEIFIYLDSGSPLVSFVGYEDVTFKKNTDNLELNLLISDSGSGLTDSFCIADVKGVNNSMPISNGWCNFSSISLSELTDGNKTIKVYVNDTLNNVRFDYNYVVWVDTTPPSLDFDCVPSTVLTGETVTCTCNATDSGSGVNKTEYSVNPSTSTQGTFTRTCTSTDNIGNLDSTTTQYTVNPSSSADPEDDAEGDSETVEWIFSYTINETEAEKGYTEVLSLKRRILATIDSEEHSVGVLEVNESHVTLQIASTPIQKILGIGQSLKLNLVDDGFYDLYILLNGILSNSTANLTVQNIHEEISSASEEGEGSANQNNTGGENLGGETERSKGKILIWSIILGFILALIIILYFAFRKKPASKETEVYEEEEDSIYGEEGAIEEDVGEAKGPGEGKEPEVI